MAQDARVKIGVLAGAAPIVDANDDVLFDAVGLAAVHEFGSVKMHIPARPFLRTTMVSGKEKFKTEITSNRDRMLKSIADGDGDAFLNKVGAKWQGYVLDTFKAKGPGWAPIAESTKRAYIAKWGAVKGSLLWRTGALLRSIHYEVVK